MKKIVLTILIEFLLTFVGFSQKRNAIWELGGTGNLCLLDFNTGPVQLDTILRNMRFYLTNSSICDSSGSLLFYTNGIYIANANNDTMINGSGINPGSYSTGWAHFGLAMPQTAVIVTDPASTNKYYIFHLVSDYNLNLIFAWT